MEEAEYLCDRIAIMDQGSIIAQDTPTAYFRLCTRASRNTMHMEISRMYF